MESKTKENGNFFHRLHALDITTGAEKVSPPPTITATVSGIAFNPLMHTNRPGLLLLNGIVYVAYASDCDNQPYHGWIFAYDATHADPDGRLQRIAERSGRMGGFWMSGAGVAADSNGNIFISSGNGDFDTTHTSRAVDLGDTNMKLILHRQLRSLWSTTSRHSTKLHWTKRCRPRFRRCSSAAGPGRRDVPTNSFRWENKERSTVINRDQMTAGNQHYCSSGCAERHANQAGIAIAKSVQMFSVPAYWNKNVYFWGLRDNLAHYPMTNGTLAPGAHFCQRHVSRVSRRNAVDFSAWDVGRNCLGNRFDELRAAGQLSLGPAVLHAYDATNVVTELYNSSNLVADKAGNAVKFTVPTIANGKVYVGTQTELDVYGLLP